MLDSISSQRKKCSKCGEIKPRSEFYQRTSKTGVTSYNGECKPCTIARMIALKEVKRQYQQMAVAKRLAAGEKVCLSCGQMKSLEDFHKKATAGDGHAYECKECKSQRSKESYTHNSEEARKRYVKSVYSWSDDIYAILFAEQGGRCASCGDKETVIDPRTKQIRRLCIDHNHKTGVLRGLLCQACNISLGRLQDDPIRIQALLAYAEKWKPA